MKRLFLLILPVIFLTGCAIDSQSDSQVAVIADQITNVIASVSKDLVEVKTEIASAGTKVVEEPLLVDRVLLNVPFASQAPTGDWGMPYQEACEEAALIQAAKYLRNEKLDKIVMDDEIKKFVKWENDKQGLYPDASAAEVSMMAKEYFGLKAEVSTDFTLPRVKEELRAGHVILLPTAGRLLGNPNYSGDGPLYHVLVLRGFRGDTIITNDPGTRKGEKYEYSFATLAAAAHDLPISGTGVVFRPFDDKYMSEVDKEKYILKGKSVMIIISD